MKNNILTIEAFFSDKKNFNLLINEVSEEIQIFYDFVLKIFSNNYKYQIQKSSDYENKTALDLFSDNEIIEKCSVNTTKELENLLSAKNKKIILMNYSSFKKYSKLHSNVNSYNYKLDIIFFLQNYLDINDKNFVNYLADIPEYINPEIEKYKINPLKYELIYKLTESNSVLQDLRKAIFDTKKNVSYESLSKIYNLLVKEVTIKKFSFLTY